MKRNPAFTALLGALFAVTGMACNSSPSFSPALVAKASPPPFVGKEHGGLVASAASTSRTVVPTPKGVSKSVYQPPDLSYWKCSWKEVEHGDLRSSEVALTFDADWSALYTIPIINALKAQNERATFFITGHFCRKFPRETLALALAGMEIGSHSDTHPRFAKLDKKSIQQQLENAEMSFQERFGQGVKPLFRFPYGESDQASRRTVAAAGYQPIYWSLDSLDSFGKEKSARFIKRRILPRIKGGDIVLMHVSSKGAAEALPAILTALKKRGLKVVPVSELMKAG